METTKPQKRHKALQKLSREHHHGLLLSWKIRSGFKKNIEPKRIRTYANWFFKNHLIPHFEQEETHVFSILGNHHELVKKALADHRRLKRLFTNDDDAIKALSKIEEELEQHIRFEERILFKEIQLVASESQLLKIERTHDQAPFEDNLEDEFWK
ncbi:hemerythrin domain-containing protein [Flavobacteriaceae bacterium LMO-SS05]